jgi:hypothetical protein
MLHENIELLSDVAVTVPACHTLLFIRLTVCLQQERGQGQGKRRRRKAAVARANASDSRAARRGLRNPG